jgi:hypothetical protein
MEKKLKNSELNDGARLLFKPIQQLTWGKIHEKL